MRDIIRRRGEGDEESTETQQQLNILLNMRCEEPWREVKEERREWKGEMA